MTATAKDLGATAPTPTFTTAYATTPTEAPVSCIRRAGERGHANYGWLRSAHTFSFANYYDPRNMGFRALRVINEDRVAPGRGFGTHPHRDMEIVSYVLEGALEHRDSMGTGSVIRPGDVQRMSAGTGVTHSEYNHSSTEGVHFLQIWIMPDRTGHRPSYQQMHFDEASKRGRLRLVASGDGADGSVTLHRDARIHAGLFDGDEQARYELTAGRGAWVQVARGEIEVAGQHLVAGDGIAFDRPGTISFTRGKGAEVLLFDLG